MSSFQDQTLKCRDCGKDFVWTADEQAFYQSKGFTNAPVRCPECRAEKRKRFDRGPRQMYTITCANCGKEDQVPFQPKEDRPVLCSDCFRKQKEQGLQEQPAQEAEQTQGTDVPMEEPVEEEKAA